MDVKRQTCQACNGINLRNIIVRDGRTHLIYVRCVSCKELVARYVLQDYYHHGKGVESYLRAHGATGGDSGGEWLKAFQKSQLDAVKGYQKALEVLEEAHKEV